MLSVQGDGWALALLGHQESQSPVLAGHHILVTWPRTLPWASSHCSETLSLLPHDACCLPSGPSLGSFSCRKGRTSHTPLCCSRLCAGCSLGTAEQAWP